MGPDDKYSKYDLVCRQVAALREGEDDRTAILADTAALLKESFDFWWAGFYLVDKTSGVRGGEGDGGTMVLGPFQGPVACTRIPFGKGVCGTAWKEGRSLVVPDVEKFPGHIACSAASRSEIVVPFFEKGSGDVAGVIDIDGKSLSAFDETDRLCLERLASVLTD